jgi:predicted site-specific integrase-resolvase
MQETPEIDLVQAAAELHVPWHTAHRWVLTGVLRGERREGRWKVDRQDLDRLLTTRVAKAAGGSRG